MLEHPAYSIAFERFGLPSPIRNGWTRELFSPGWVTEVSQSAYGHRARKRTWLYYVGPPPPPLDWSEPIPSACVSWDHAKRNRRPESYRHVERMGKREGSATPEPFRKLLLELATLAGSARGEPQA